jgi:Protein of unknown function (DUF1214)
MLQTPQRYPRTGSQNYPSPAAVANADGSTTIWFGPKQPEGAARGNWLQTVPDKGWFTLLLESFFIKEAAEPVIAGGTIFPMFVFVNVPSQFRCASSRKLTPRGLLLATLGGLCLSLANLVGLGRARRIAANIAKLPTLLGKES